jgi:hypothetical protein
MKRRDKLGDWSTSPLDHLASFLKCQLEDVKCPKGIPMGENVKLKQQNSTYSFKSMKNQGKRV